MQRAVEITALPVRYSEGSAACAAQRLSFWVSRTPKRPLFGRGRSASQPCPDAASAALPRLLHASCTSSLGGLPRGQLAEPFGAVTRGAARPLCGRLPRDESLRGVQDQLVATAGAAPCTINVEAVGRTWSPLEYD